MVEVINLAPGELSPDGFKALPVPKKRPSSLASTVSHLFVRHFRHLVFYASLAEDDVSLETALAAATDWAVKYGVRRIWVQAIPD
jgi:hypothetical protein